MADGRDIDVWSRHADEQAQDNLKLHNFNDDYVLREWVRGLKEIEKVVDFGCGSGLWRDLFKEYDYLGLDQNDDMVKQAKERGESARCRFQRTLWNSLHLAKDSIDLVFTAAVLQHNNHVDKAVVLREIVRILKPGGYFMCSENTFRKDNYKLTFPDAPEFKEQMHDKYSFTRSGWGYFMKQFGLKMIKFKKPSEYLYQVVM